MVWPRVWALNSRLSMRSLAQPAGLQAVVRIMWQPGLLQGQVGPGVPVWGGGDTELRVEGDLVDPVVVDVGHAITSTGISMSLMGTGCSPCHSHWWE